MSFKHTFILKEEQYLKFPNLYPLLKSPQTNISDPSPFLKAKIKKVAGDGVGYKQYDTLEGSFYSNTVSHDRFGWGNNESKIHEGFHFLMDVIYNECTDCYYYIMNDFLKIVETGLGKSYKKYLLWFVDRGYSISSIEEKEELITGIQDIVNNKADRDSYLNFMEIKVPFLIRSNILKIKRVWKALNEMSKQYYFEGDMMHVKRSVDDIINQFFKT